MPTSMLSPEGRVSIPDSVRDILNLKPGDQVEFVIDGNRIVMRRTTSDLTELDGFLDRSAQKPVSIEKMDEVIREKACTGNQQR